MHELRWIDAAGRGIAAEAPAALAAAYDTLLAREGRATSGCTDRRRGVAAGRSRCHCPGGRVRHGRRSHGGGVVRRANPVVAVRSCLARRRSIRQGAGEASPARVGCHPAQRRGRTRCRRVAGAGPDLDAAGRARGGAQRVPDRDSRPRDAQRADTRIGHGRGRRAPRRSWSRCCSRDHGPSPCSSRSTKRSCSLECSRSGHRCGRVRNATRTTVSPSTGTCGRQRLKRRCSPIGSPGRISWSSARCFTTSARAIPGDHTERGEELVATIGPRMGFDERDTGHLVGLVRHHLLLPDIATAS